MKRGPYRKRPIAERFWEKVEKSSSCWLWKGAGVRYGMFGINQKMIGAPPSSVRATLWAYPSWQIHLPPLRYSSMCQTGAPVSWGSNRQSR